MNGNYLAILFFVIGVITRMVLPWLIDVVNQLRSDEGGVIAWRWRYLGGQLTAAIVVLILTPVLVEDFETAFSTWKVAWLVGYAVAEAGRMVDKLITPNQNE